MRVIVCGGRDYRDKETLFAVLDGIQITTLIHGGATGADALADAYARARRITSAVFAANWRAHGKSAGPIRNQRMIDEGAPDVVVAFPGGRGTLDMCRRAAAARIAVLHVGGVTLAKGGH